MKAFADGYDSKPGAPDSDDEGKWLLTAQQCYRSSTDFFNGNLRKQLEESMDLWRSRHPGGSKYNLPSFQKRSHLFRPKIRSAMRKKEAQVAKAFFSTKDIVTVMPLNEADENHVLAAKVQQALLQKRLEQVGPSGMQWFLTLVAAFQDASKQGFVIAKTEWDFREAKEYYSDDGTGKAGTKMRVTRDRPFVKILPGENIRVDPACDWTDPINSSSYLIEMMPLSIREIREWQAKQTTWQWKEVSDQQLMSGLKQEFDSVRQSREGNKQDRYDQKTGLNEFETVWIHQNIVRIEGEDYVFLTIGTEILLTEPMPLSELDPRGYRPYTWGFTVIEAHNPYPDGDVQMAKPVQEEINEIANMRADALKMATIGRYFYRRGSAIDTELLTRFVPGSAVEVTNIQTDVRWDKAPDAGRGAFEEGNLLNSELSDLLGTFQSGEVQQNRKLNETVGGMNLLADNANEVAEFTVRTFCETWVEPTLCQVLDLLCHWETDEKIAGIVGDKFKIEVKDVFRALNEPMQSSVAVGYGATNPESRIRRLQIAVGVTQQIDPFLMQSANKEALVNEVWGAVGFDNAKRFFPTIGDGSEASELKRVQQELAQLKQQLEQGGAGDAAKLQIAKLQQETQLKLAEMKQAGAVELANLNNQLKFLIEKAKGELGMLDLRIKFEANDIKKQELYMQREALSHSIQMSEREFALAVQSQATAQQNVEADRADAKEERDAKASEQQSKGQPDTTPPGVKQLIENLRNNPGSGPVDDNGIGAAFGGEAGDVATGEPDFSGDEAGVVARGDYGMIPGAEG